MKTVHGLKEIRPLDEDTFEELARDLRIPLKLWNDPAMWIYADVYRHLHILMEDLTTYRQLLQPDWSNNGNLVKDANGAGIKLSLGDRYSQANDLLAVLVHLLQGEFGIPTGWGYLKEKLENVLEPYALKVVREPRRSR